MAAAPESIDSFPVSPLAGDRLAALSAAVSGFDREQLLWASGYLAGLAQHGAREPLAPAGPAAAEARWTIFYATETGNSRRVATALAERARDAGLVADLKDLRDFRPKQLASLQNALFVVATHGLGEPPDGTELFFEYWHSEKAPRLD
ncbi:MAG: flavodoxin domain-containing protein, partial [Woeseiaceae bacterium]